MIPKERVPRHIWLSTRCRAVVQDLRQQEREAAGLRQVVSPRQAGPAAHTVLVKTPEGERWLPTARDERGA